MDQVWGELGFASEGSDEESTVPAPSAPSEGVQQRAGGGEGAVASSNDAEWHAPVCYAYGFEDGEVDNRDSDGDREIDSWFEERLTPEFIEADAYDLMYKSMLHSAMGKGAADKAERDSLSRAHYDDKTDIESCVAATKARCDCFVDCALRSGVTARVVQESRMRVHSRSVDSGDVCRIVAQMIIANKTEAAMRLHEEDPRRRSDGSLHYMNQVHCVVNGWDV